MPKVCFNFKNAFIVKPKKKQKKNDCLISNLLADYT